MRGNLRDVIWPHTLIWGELYFASLFALHGVVALHQNGPKSASLSLPNVRMKNAARLQLLIKAARRYTIALLVGRIKSCSLRSNIILRHSRFLLRGKRRRD